MRALIFGISGQDGHYMKELCEANNIEVVGVSRSVGEWIKGDVCDRGFVNRLVSEYKPDYIFNFAANSTTKHDVLFENHQTISTGSLNILESVKSNSPITKVFLSGSALQFLNTENPIQETDLFSATSAYSVERIYTTYLGRYYRNLGLKVYVGYFFHHDSPKRSERHLNMFVIKSLIAVKQQLKEFMEIGNLNIVKEFNFAGDIVSAVWTLVNQENVFEAVIGSGKGHSIREWVEICCNQIGVEMDKHVIETGNFRNEFKKLVSNSETILGLGWVPKYDIYSLASMMIEAEVK